MGTSQKNDWRENLAYEGSVDI